MSTRTIHKFRLTIGEKMLVPIPRTATPIAVGEQDGFICMWVELDAMHAVDGGRWFSVVGTGWELDNHQCKTHIGTVQARGYVWHVYESE